MPICCFNFIYGLVGGEGGMQCCTAWFQNLRDGKRITSARGRALKLAGDAGLFFQQGTQHPSGLFVGLHTGG